MKKTQKVITRRDFIRTGSCMVMGGVMGLPVLGHTAFRAGAKSRVVLIRDKNVVVGHGSFQNSTLEETLHRQASYQAINYMTRDFKEGIDALREKRTPNFQDDY